MRGEREKGRKKKRKGKERKEVSILRLHSRAPDSDIGESLHKALQVSLIRLKFENHCPRMLEN